MRMEKKSVQALEHTLFDADTNGLQLFKNSSSGSMVYITPSHEKKTFFTSLIDSFKPYDYENDGVDTSQMTEVEKSNYATSKQPLARKLKGRHLQMISLGGSIGTGLFVGSGSTLATGGPAGQLIAYIVVGYSLFCVMNALGEMSVQFPVSGSFNAYFTRFVDPSWGFTLGHLYALSVYLLFPLELVACSLTVGYWNQSINPSVWVTIFLVIICSINFFGVKIFGEVEFVLSGIKLVSVIGFLILGICLICGAGNQGYIGAQYWHNPGSFNHGFKGVCLSFISAAFSFGGIEFISLAAAETVNPQKSLPRAAKQIFWRVTIFYVLTSIIIGCLVPYNDSRLLSGKSSVDITASPFVIAISNGGIRALPHIMNVVILLTVVSVGSTSIYGCSRVLTSLALQGFLPKCVGYVDKMGRPTVAILVSSTSGALGYLAADADQQQKIFDWFLSLCALAGFFTWMGICFTHLRWRWALNRQGRSLDEVYFISPTGIWGSVSGIVIFLLIIIGQIWTSLWEIDATSASAKNFFISCLSLPLMIVLWAGYKTYTRSWGQLMVPLGDVDLDIGRRELDVYVIKQEIAEERAQICWKPIWYRVYRLLC